MANPPLKHNTYDAPSYGSYRKYLEETIVGQGAAAPVVKPTSDVTNPPCAAEIFSITRTSAGIYVITFFDAYYAVASATADIDDTAAIGSYATIGNWTNLQTSVPAVCTLRTWNAAGSAPTDIPLNTACRLAFAFKTAFTGQVA